METEQHPDVRFAGIWIRFGAAFIDGLILTPLVLIELYNKLNYHSITLLILGTFLTMAYKPYLEYIQGATIGKRILGIRVVNEEFDFLTLDQAILRYMPWFISAAFGFMFGLEYYWSGEYVENMIELNLRTQESFWSEVSSLYLLIFVIIIGMIAFDKNKQGIHDKLAKTYCIYN